MQGEFCSWVCKCASLSKKMRTKCRKKILSQSALVKWILRETCFTRNISVLGDSKVPFERKTKLFFINVHVVRITALWTWSIELRKYEILYQISFNAVSTRFKMG